MNITAFDLAQRYVGIAEISGEKNHPLVSWWLSLCGFGLDSPDEIPWCSAFVNGIAWELRLPRSKSALARSWLGVGVPVNIGVQCKPAWDVVVLKRGAGDQPGPGNTTAPGHVGLFAGINSKVLVLGGNQGNAVSIQEFPIEQILGVRRLRSEEA